MRHRLGALTGLAMLGAPGCVATESIPEGSMVRDSAGVRLVEYRAGLPRTSISVTLEWEHGLVAGDYEFQRIFLGGLHEDGSGVVGDAGNQEVVLMDAAGRFNGVLAETGQGPSEVMRPRVVLTAGPGTVWVEDPGNTKLMRFQDGSLVETLNTSENVALARGMMPIGVVEDGDLLMVTASYRSDFPQPWLDGHLTRFDPTTRALDTLSSYPMASRRPETGINPFGAWGEMAAAGDYVVQVRTDLPEVTWRDSYGTVVQIVRWNPEPTYPTDELWAQFETRMRATLERVNPQMPRERMQQFLDDRVGRYSMDPSAPLPLFGGPTVGGTDGDVWLPDAAAPRARPTRYTVIAGDGESVGIAEFPRPFTVLDSAGGLVLGVYEDALGVQAVAVYRFSLGE